MNTVSLTRADTLQKEDWIDINRQPLWLQQYKTSITNIDELCKLLKLNKKELNLSNKNDFKFRVPLSYVNRMQKSNPNDPLLLQVLPQAYEDNIVPGFNLDPVSDLNSCKAPGLLQKYNHRALVIASSRCAIHCRYCFRRHFPYTDQNARTENWYDTLSTLSNDSSIHEVILSGGDPLVLDDKVLLDLTDQIQKIPHIKTLRLHTRVPVVIPERITYSLANWIQNTRLKVVMVLHINHANEINSELINSLKTLDCTLLNQSVLLRDINDAAESIINLSHALFNANILPYYLHLLDRVQGAAHFEVTENSAKQIMREIASELPGYLVPKLVKEVAGQAGKTLINI